MLTEHAPTSLSPTSLSWQAILGANVTHEQVLRSLDRHAQLEYTPSWCCGGSANKKEMKAKKQEMKAKKQEKIIQKELAAAERAARWDRVVAALRAADDEALRARAAQEREKAVKEREKAREGAVCSV